MGLPFGTHHASPLHHTANRYKVLYYSHSIKPVPVAGREAHIHLCLVSVVRSSTSGPLVASDTDSSPAPSPQPSSLQFVAVGIRRPRRQSYVVFQYVKELISFHSLRKVRDSNPRAIADLLLSRELPYHSANLPLVLCLAILSQGLATSAASYRHTARSQYSLLSGAVDKPTVFLSSRRSAASPSPASVAVCPHTSPPSPSRTSGTACKAHQP